MVGARLRALAAYKDFLTLWKDADDIPILKGAKTEYAKLQSREKSCLVACCFTDTVVNSDSPHHPARLRQPSAQFPVRRPLVRKRSELLVATVSRPRTSNI